MVAAVRRNLAGLAPSCRSFAPGGAWGCAAPALLALLSLGACGGTQNPGGQGGQGIPVPDCAIEADGEIAGEELPLLPGIAVRYARNEPGTEVSFDFDGSPGPGGGRWWDFSDGPADVGSTFVTRDPAGDHYRALFPTATFAVPMLVEMPQLLGVYRWRPDAGGGGELQLLGLTTEQEPAPAARTLVRYDEPVTALRLPLREGESWGQQATFRDAVVAGVPNQGVEDWSFEVDAAGGATLPGGLEVEQVLRVRSRVDATYAVALGPPRTTLHRLSWYAPCFGEIAGISGPEEDLEPAAEMRRYYP